MVVAILILILMLMGKDPKAGFIREEVHEALVEFHVVLGRSAVGLDFSWLPGDHFGANGIN